MSTEIDYRTRDFLNLDGFHAGAYLLTSVKAGVEQDGECWVSTGFTVSDCSRVVDLDFSAYSLPARDNALFKAHLLRERVNAFVDTFELAHLTYDVTTPRRTLILPGSAACDVRRG